MQTPAEWLEEYRAKDKTGWVTTEFDLEDFDMDGVEKAADLLSMTMEEFFNYAITTYIEEKIVGHCVTCHKALFTFVTPCYNCGDINE